MGPRNGPHPHTSARPGLAGARLDSHPFPGRNSRTAFGRLAAARSEEHTSELQSRLHLGCRLLLEKKKNNHYITTVRRGYRLSDDLSGGSCYYIPAYELVGIV